MPSPGTFREIFRYTASGLSAAWAAIGIATAIGAGLGEGPSVSAVSGIFVNVLLLAAAALAFTGARRWRVAILATASLVTVQRISVVIGYGGATFTVIAALLALVAIAGPTLVGIVPARR
jgi:hypothetical protein